MAAAISDQPIPLDFNVTTSNLKLSAISM